MLLLRVAKVAMVTSIADVKQLHLISKTWNSQLMGSMFFQFLHMAIFPRMEQIHVELPFHRDRRDSTSLVTPS